MTRMLIAHGSPFRRARRDFGGKVSARSMSRSHAWIRFLLAIILIAGTARQAGARTFFIQPYLGLKPSVALGARSPLYPAESFVGDASSHFGKLADSANLIFIGINGEPRKVETTDPGEVEYEAEVRLYDLMKFRNQHIALNFLTLRWKSSSTSIGAMERHLFFVRDEVDADGNHVYKVLRAAYMSPDSRKPHLAVRRLGTPYRPGAAIPADSHRPCPPKGFADTLAQTLRSDPSQTPLLTLLPVDLAHPGWMVALRQSRHTTTDLHVFGTMAADIVERGDDADLLALLKSTEAVSFGMDGKYSPIADSINRRAESIVFDLFRHHGDARLTKLLVQYGDGIASDKSKDKQYGTIVSTAFALAEIGGAGSADAIKRWKADATVARQTVRIGGTFVTTVTCGELLDAALKRLEEKHAERQN